MEPSRFYLSPDLVSPPTSWVVIVLFGIVLLSAPLVWALVERARHRRQAAHDRRAMSSAHDPTRLGPIVVAGKVADDGEGAAITIDITQRGREWQYKGQWNQEWREVERAVAVRPFYVVRPAGERLRVEPDQGVFLVDKLDGLQAEGSDRRRRQATLTAGELVFVVGTATQGFDPQKGGYRDGASGFVVRPPRASPMLISTEPLAERHERAARDDGKLALIMLLALLVTHGLVFRQAWHLALGGHVETARVNGRYTFRTWSSNRSGGGHWVTHYGVESTLPGGAVNRDETSLAFYNEAGGLEETVPILIAGGEHQLGTQAAVQLAAVAMEPFAALLLVGVALAWRRSRRPWYLRKLVIERIKGRLDPSKIQLK